MIAEVSRLSHLSGKLKPESKENEKMDLKAIVLNLVRATVLPYGKDLYLKYIQSRYQKSYRGLSASSRHMRNTVKR